MITSSYIKLVKVIRYSLMLASVYVNTLLQFQIISFMSRNSHIMVSSCLILLWTIVTTCNTSNINLPDIHQLNMAAYIGDTNQVIKVVGKQLDWTQMYNDSGSSLTAIHHALRGRYDSLATQSLQLVGEHEVCEFDQFCSENCILKILWEQVPWFLKYQGYFVIVANYKGVKYPKEEFPLCVYVKAFLTFMRTWTLITSLRS